MASDSWTLRNGPQTAEEGDYRRDDDDDDDRYRSGSRRRRGFLGDLFDFDRVLTGRLGNIWSLGRPHVFRLS